MLMLAECFTMCLKEGVFPKACKRADLVLIAKVGDNAGLRYLKRPDLSASLV